MTPEGLLVLWPMARDRSSSSFFFLPHSMTQEISFVVTAKGITMILGVSFGHFEHFSFNNVQIPLKIFFIFLGLWKFSVKWKQIAISKPFVTV